MNFPNTQIPITYENLMASIYENDRFIREKFAETDRQMKETDRQIKETKALIKKTGEQIKETGEQMKETDRRLGAWANNYGTFAEEYFFNSFEYGNQNFFGETFDEIEKNLKIRKNKVRYEYDIVMYNCSSIAIIEVKYKAHLNDIPSIIKQAETFRYVCPEFHDFKIYLGLASLSFYPELEQECMTQGIAIIKQVGDSVVINDSKLKVF
jgi:hypothetical protein